MMSSEQPGGEDAQPVEREVEDRWMHPDMGVKAEEVTLRRGDHEEKRIVVYRKEKRTYASLETGEPETTERWVKITSLTEQAATETLFALAEAYGYELEAR